ncbi:MAG: type II toxin-antitoxin system antitoxin SocA domain-containing protein [Candidatus Berkelbacteria bacterium]
MTNSFKKLLSDKNITQEKLADIFCVSRPTAAKIIAGEKEMTISEVRKLAEVLGVSIEEVLGERETKEIILEKCLSKPQEVVERISIPAENVEKFKNVLLYITQKIGALPNIGQTVLYKILYFCDFDYYEKFEEQLIGARYIRNHYGPTPVEFAAVVKEMVNDGQIEEVKTKFFNKEQTKYIPVTSPDLSVLTGQELNHIDEEIERLSGKTAKELSDFSHKDVPWIVTPEGKEIPYETVFYRTPETSVRDYDVKV